MAKVSPNNIQNLDENWGHDENTGLPFSGESVQAFIKSYLRKVTGAAWFDTTTATMYFFATEGDRDTFINDPSQTSLLIFSCQMNFSGILYRVNITNNNGSTNLNVATNSGTLPLSLSYVVQEKAITDISWTDTVTRCYVTVLIDRGLTGEYTPITERTLYNSGANITLDVFQYLANGSNHVKFQFEAEDGTVTSALTYTVTLAELYVELFNNTWYEPVIPSDVASRQLGGFKIAGAGSKTLHISLFNSSGQKVVDDLTALIGTTNAYASTPYYYRFDTNNPIAALPTGVYTVRVYVSTSAIDSEVIEYNIMLVAAADLSTAKLVCLNDIADRAYNYATTNLCRYAVYDGGASYADLTATFLRKDGAVTVGTSEQTLEGVTAGEAHVLSYEVLWPGIEGTGYSIDFLLELGAAQASASVPIDNSTVFPPTDGYDFYLLAANRSNSEAAAARQKIVNLADDSQLAATWTDVDFVNGMDGWTVDDEGRACLRIPAGSKMVLPASAFQFFAGDNSTLELCFKVANVADYDEDVITIGTGHGTDAFAGIRIKPNNVTIHSKADLTAANDSKQGTNLCDEEPVHLVLSVNPYYNGSNKLVKGYVNGCKNFLFTYGSSVDWQISGGLTIGSAKSDVFLYFIRHYPVALADAAVQVNYINSLGSVTERSETNERFASVLDSGQTNVDYEAVKNNGYNFFVITMERGNGVPSDANGWGKKTDGVSTLEMHYGAHPDWDWKMEHLETMGQGTTSMNYFRWNIRWRIDKSNSAKKVPVRYLASRTKSGGKYIYEWADPADSKTVRFDGDNHPAVMRITAKTNSASSMQGHKIGATRAYTELHDAIGLRNEAQVIADDNDAARPVVAVYQYPCFGFEYDPQTETYTYIGLFTIGPDKGDKPTFGFDTVKNTLISMEGTDHNQQLATFTYPYDEGTGTGKVNYFYTEEGIGINKGDGTFNTGLEIGNCHGKEIDKEKGSADESDVRAILDDEFKPAYDLVWHNSTLIFPVALDDATYGGANAAAVLAAINADVDAFQRTQYAADPRLTYGDMQFWIEGEYKLYWYNPLTAQYVEGDALGSPTGSTLAEQNENYKAARRSAFKAEAEDWWDIQDSLYHFCFLVLIGATDNFAKNSYPYKMALQANGGRWKWRQDDLDTIFDIDNMGQGTKPYHIEFMDSNGGTPFFAGGRSIFWNLLYECYWENYISTVTGVSTRGGRSIGQDIISAMTSLSGKNNHYDGFVGYISECFWGRAQDYFPASAYNVDAEFKYELAWLSGRHSEALPQGLGDHYAAERLWVQRRAVYMLSLFRCGPFGDYTDTKLGRIRFRPAALTYVPVPVMWMYPALLTGAGGAVSGGRTQPGVACPLVYSGAFGETEFYFQATNYLSKFGNLKGLRLASGYVNAIGIEGAKLTEFLIGDAVASNVDTNVPGLDFANTRCLEKIDARNAESVASVTGLANCIRLRTLLLEGTSVTSVDIPSGSRLETLTFPDSIQRLSLRNLKRLTTFDPGDCSSVITLIVDGCPNVDAFGLLEDVLDASESLRYIRILWNGIYEDESGEVLGKLASLLSEEYLGIAADGETVTRLPFIEGTIDVSGAELTAHDLFDGDLTLTDIQDYGDGLKKARVENFGTALYLIFDPATVVYEMFLTTEDGAFVTTEDDYFIKLSESHE